MSNNNQPRVSRLVPAAFITFGAATLMAAVVLSIGFWKTTFPDIAQDWIAPDLDSSPFPAFFSDSELDAMRAPPPPVRRAPKALARAPESRRAEPSVAVEVLGELAQMKVSEEEPAKDPALARAGEVWFDGAARARTMGKLETAKNMLLRAVDRAPDRGEYWVALAEVQTDLGHSGDAANAWRRAAELRQR
ncbi:MAG: hypothetical protein KDA24_14660 [Deltaproteobacteria bacterium]|nr:hypothetical protein [Deltaproteobacteria bacterium]